MSEGDSLLDQADALMRRQRLFVAATQAEAEATRNLESNAETGQDDLPLLTEVVVTVPNPATNQNARGARLMDERRAALALQLDKWLDEQLPQLVILAMDGITDQLIALISNRVREELMPRLDAILKPDDDGERTG